MTTTDTPETNALLVARAIDRIVHEELDDAFTLEQARLYAIVEGDSSNDGESNIQMVAHDNPYELMMNYPRPPATVAGCLVVTGWAAPLGGEPGDNFAPDKNEPTVRPSEHPLRRRVRVCVAICAGEIGTVMRTDDEPDEIKPLSERGMGGIPDVLEDWWNGSFE